MNKNFDEKAIKEFCKQCVEHSNLTELQKITLKEAVDQARNMQELIATGVIGLIGS